MHSHGTTICRYLGFGLHSVIFVTIRLCTQVCMLCLSCCIGEYIPYHVRSEFFVRGVSACIDLII